MQIRLKMMNSGRGLEEGLAKPAGIAEVRSSLDRQENLQVDVAFSPIDRGRSFSVKLR